MFSRIILEDWSDRLQLLSLIVLFPTYFLAIVRTWLMKKEKLEHMASLPFAEEADAQIG